MAAIAPAGNFSDALLRDYSLGGKTSEQESIVLIMDSAEVAEANSNMKQRGYSGAIREL